MQNLYELKLIRDLFGVEPRISKRKGKTTDIRTFHRNIVRFLIDNVGMATAPKGDRARIPGFYIDSVHVLDVLRGCFDTDGSVVLANNNGILYPRIEIKICQSPMQNQIIKILKSNGFRFGVYDLGNGHVRIQMNGKKQLRKWSNEIGFSNPKHYRKAEKIK